MKVVYPPCCGVDIHKSFLAAAIIKTPKDNLQPSYQKRHFSTFNSELIEQVDICINTMVQVARATVKDKTNPCYALKYERIARRRGRKQAVTAIARLILTAIYSHALHRGNETSCLISRNTRT